MKNLKKLLILPLVVLVASFSSCSDIKSDPYFGYVFVTEIETSNYETGKLSVSTYDYVQYDKNYKPQPIVNATVTSIPILARQTFTNNDVSEIKYTYTDQMKNLEIVTKTNESETMEKYRLNDLMMADAKMVGEIYVPLENIKYDAKGFRTYYDGYDIYSESNEYKRVEKDGEVVATYEYTMHPNAMSFQQLNIPGEKYYNACDNFGKQSRYFLSRATIVEQGVNVVYDYTYYFDYNGYIVEEMIMKDRKPYINRKYRYKSVTVSTSVDAE